MYIKAGNCSVRRDGISWTKRKSNPIFVCDGNSLCERTRVGGCQVVKTNDMGYLMFYIGYEDIDTARICVARSDDGIVGWERSKHNPLIEPEKNMWDGDACYKPTVLWNEKKYCWMLWYNGRLKNLELIGLAECDKRNLFGSVK